MSFPTQVNTVQAPAVAGDFSDANPRSTVDAGPGAFVAGVGGVTIGKFAWADFTTGLVLNSGSGAPTGFVHREQQALITAYLAESGSLIPQGMPVSLHSSGGFWVTNGNAGAVTVTNPPQKAFANNTGGDVKFGAAGASGGALAGYTETKFVLVSAGAAGELVKITSHLLG